MTSISQPVLPPQASNNAVQTVASVPSPSASTSGRAPPQAAGTASATAKTSYASATKKTFSPPSASGSAPPQGPLGGSTSAQHGKPEISTSVNGKVVVPPAVPAVGPPTIVNGNTPTSSHSGLGDHGRKPSVTISAAGASGYTLNGGPAVGKPASGNSIQFGSHPNATGSPSAPNSIQPPVQSSNSLAVAPSSNPRLVSPQTSPSPIPQPPASGGGRPPSSLHGANNSVSFGNFGGSDANVSKTGLYFMRTSLTPM